MTDDATRPLHDEQLIVEAEPSWHERVSNALLWRRKVRERLQTKLRASMKGLQLRLRSRWINDVVDRALAHDPALAVLWRESEALQCATMATLLQRVVLEYLEQNRVEEIDLAILIRQLDRAADEDSSELLLRTYLRRKAPSIFYYWGDLRALSRRMDLDALRERVDEIRNHNFSRIEVAVAGYTHLWLSGYELASQERPDFEERAREASPLEFVFAVAVDNPRWPTRMFAFDRLAAMLAVAELGSLAAKQIEALAETVRDTHEHPWVRRNALRCVRLCDAQLANLLTDEALLEPYRSSEYEFIFRSIALLDEVELARKDERARAVVLSHWRSGDPSEHVRIRLAAALATLSPDDDQLRECLVTRLAWRDGACIEPSAKVRAMCMRSVGHLLRDRAIRLSAAANDNPGRPVSDAIVDQLAALLQRSLLQDSDDLVLRSAALEAAQSTEFIERNGRRSRCGQAIGMWSTALLHLRSRSDRSFRSNEEAAAALERIYLCSLPNALAATDELVSIIESIPRGHSLAVRRTKALAEVSRDTLGRICAVQSRRDWGLYIEEQAKKLRIQRAEKMRTRLWRILNELRTPSPNKRQAFTHSTGRHYRGTIRAHPGRLDEVTPTVVPGERITVDSEGGWGRHLPQVDDVLGRPLPSTSKPVEIHSSLGVTKIWVKGSWWRRHLIRLRLSISYARLADLRRQSLLSDDANERALYVRTLANDYGVQIEFAPHSIGGNIPNDAVAQPIAQLMALSDSPNDTMRVDMSKAAALLPAAWNPAPWLAEHAHYFLSDVGNQQTSLSIFLVTMMGYFLIDGYRRRKIIRNARLAIPLSIGGWGTRGKSGTERLKAAVFHGLGYRVFSKTTGCEAMLIHSVAEGPQSEIFVFRPYGKATIWEQGDLIQLAASVHADVFLWECMALNPSYVALLQHEWMRDDLATLTNAYPDHEDIQGPAGMNVADVISRFIPRKSVVISSEINFQPILRDVAKAQQSEFVGLEDDDSEWIGGDFLALFPYQEHPRNIALVATMAEKLQVERDLALLNMAQYVVPDLGVLKTYGDVCARGRTMRFINGCSANERTGFMNNWNRTGCATLDANNEPGRMVITVVNNREDRISRSEVFSRILVQDAATDRNILIGTNLKGLLGYIDDALNEYLEAVRLATAKDLESESTEVMRRFEKMMKRHRCPTPGAQPMVTRFCIYAGGIGVSIAQAGQDVLSRVIAAYFDAPEKLPAPLRDLRDALARDAALNGAIDECLTRHASPTDSSGSVECIAPATAADVKQHFIRQLSRALCVHRLRANLQKILKEKDASALPSYHEALRKRYAGLFRDTLDVVEDSSTTGDQIIDRCARSVPPGIDVSIMGTQNIKGTGLDFVYRWVSLGIVFDLLKKAGSANARQRLEALAQLESHGDHGIVDLGTLRGALKTLRSQGSEESEAIERLGAKVERLYAKKLQALTVVTTSKRDYIGSFLNWVEGWIEFLDGARRMHQSRSLSRDLRNLRVSHAKAAIEMRELYDRTKGGWLAKKFRG